MTYPTLTARASDHVVGTLGTSAEEHERTEHVVLSEGPRFDAPSVEAAAQRFQLEWQAERDSRRNKGKEADVYFLEAFMASRIHRSLKDLPMDLLQDFGFWRYLGLFPFRWYMQAREGGSTLLDLKPQDYGGTSKKNDESDARVQASPTYHLILRTFLWGKIAQDRSEEEDPYRRTTLVNDTDGAVTDVWHSHLVRIQLGQLGRLPHAFLDSICEEPRANGVDPARAVEKRLTRMKHTVLFDLYDLDGAKRLVDQQKALAVPGAPAEGEDD